MEADVCSSAPDVYRHFITSCKFTHLTNTHTHGGSHSHTHRCLSITDLRLWSTWGSADHRFLYRDPTKENTLIVVDHGRFWELISEINLLSFFVCFVHPIRSQNSRRRRVLLLPRPLTNSHSFTNKSIMCGEHEETRGWHHWPAGHVGSCDPDINVQGCLNHL